MYAIYVSCPIVLVKNLKLWCLNPSTSSDFFRDQGVEDAGAADPDSAAGHVDFALEQQNGGKSKKMMKNDGKICGCSMMFLIFLQISGYMSKKWGAVWKCAVLD